MAIIWTGMVGIAIFYGMVSGCGQEVAAAAIEGANAAVQLCINMAGVLCLWMGVMEIMRRSGIAGKLSGLLYPVLRRLYPEFAEDTEVMEAVSANVASNLLGLGSAATPMGVRAACLMSRKTPGKASASLCTLVVCNTASIQLFPTTVAAVRLSAGCQTPFDILPAVWITSLLSVCTGLAAARLLGRVWK